ncbi:MAG TPA: ATP-binding protein [Roseiflexaceae bacterium]|nr:ATP-binding protein [Roseiflexaceae bacterium]
MLLSRRTSQLKTGALVVAGLALMVLALWLTPSLARQLVSTEGFSPHAYCLVWEPGLLRLFVITDTLIGLSYVAISLALVALVYQTHRDMPFNWMFLVFGAFIVACGSTHFMDVVTLWLPVYWLSGSAKLITAVASVMAAIVVPPAIPRVRELVRAAKLSQERKQSLELANRELELLYSRLKRQDELRAQFYANISHELRTPLTLIIGPAERLLVSGRLPVAEHASVDLIRRNAATLLTHVNNLLEVARLESDQVRVRYADVDLARLLRLCAGQFDDMARARGISVTLDMATVVPAQLDSALIERVVMNLLGNAFKFTPGGGRIRLSLGVEGDQVRVCVADSGPGVPPEQRALIFERFHQAETGVARRYAGTGLGLFIVRQLVELHGGSVAVGDAPEGGALFVVTLPQRAPEPGLVEPAPALPAGVAPLVQLPPESSHMADEPSLPDDQRPLVLVVEDHSDMRAFLRAELSRRYRVVEAADGRTGLEQATMLRPDLIVSDLMMPGMSGDQLVTALQDAPELRETPVVLLTARADPDLRVRMLRAGARDYIVKPFSTEELVARIDQLLGAVRARALLQRELATTSADLADLAGQLAARSQALDQAVRARDVFLSIASHELKTPLTSLLGFAELLERRSLQKGGMAEREQRLVRIIVEQALRLDRLIAGMLDLSRLENGQFVLEFASIDLTELVRRMVGEVEQSLHQHPVALELPDEPLCIEGDPLRLEQVIYNLLQNAIKYSPAGGPIDIQLRRDNGSAVLSVRDQGLGIPEADLPHLFQRFYRASNINPSQISGTGIGLYVVHEILARHGGTIDVLSTVGEGSTFTVQVPLEK